MEINLNKTLATTTLLIVILAFCTTGYMLIEGSNFSDSLYMTLITISTVGYGETVNLSPAGRYFTMALILSGVGFVMFNFDDCL